MAKTTFGPLETDFKMLLHDFNAMSNKFDALSGYKEYLEKHANSLEEKLREKICFSNYLKDQNDQLKEKLVKYVGMLNSDDIGPAAKDIASVLAPKSKENEEALS